MTLLTMQAYLSQKKLFELHCQMFTFFVCDDVLVSNAFEIFVLVSNAFMQIF